MGTTFKALSPKDMTTQMQPFHEAVLIPGSTINYLDPHGTYPGNTNVKEVSNKNFVQVFDYAYTDASASLGFDITYGVSDDSIAYETPQSGIGVNPFAFEYGVDGWPYDIANDEYHNKRANMYNELAQYLVGFDTTGQIRHFDRDGDFSTATDKMEEVIALNFSRFLAKEGIKKGSFELIMGMNPNGYIQVGGGWAGAPHTPVDNFMWDGALATSSYIKITDFNGNTSYKVNSPRGEYGILYAQNCDSTGAVLDDAGVTQYTLMDSILDADNKVPVGLIFYQAGIAIITPWIFGPYDAALWTAGRYGFLTNSNIVNYIEESLFYDNGHTYNPVVPPAVPVDCYSILHILRGYQFDVGVEDTDITMLTLGHIFRQRIYSLKFQNTIELQSSIVFCRLGHNEFNYSSNPTYVTDSKINVKEVTTDIPKTYYTEIGLYSADDVLLAHGTFSKPILKDPSIEAIYRFRLDF